jgi:hypothetical protein
MLKSSKIFPSLTRTLKYSIIPTSCYDILAKPNPIISVKIGNDDGIFCNLNFRVQVSLLIVILKYCAKDYIKL